MSDAAGSGPSIRHEHRQGLNEKAGGEDRSANYEASRRVLAKMPGRRPVANHPVPAYRHLQTHRGRIGQCNRTQRIASN